jgi:hypothetical protein
MRYLSRVSTSHVSDISTSHVSSVRMSHTSLVKVLGVAVLAIVVSAHVGSPDVFFAGTAGPYDIRVVVRPPQVVPGIARVTVRTPADVQRASIRPVFWRAGSKGAPSGDEMRQLEGQAGTFEGSIWLMARGAYTVDVSVTGSRGTANVLVPVASVATGRLGMNPVLGVLLAALGIMLFAGLVNIVYKAAGESLVESGDPDAARRRSARRVAAIAVPILGLAIFGGARWWGAVDTEYQRSIYTPSPLNVVLRGDTLDLRATDDLFLPGGRVARLIPDHGKLMHLFLVSADGAQSFAHLHPQPTDSTPRPTFRTRLPALPSGQYRVFADVVHETGFERTLVGSLTLPAPPSTPGRSMDADDAWYVGDASRERSTRLSDGSMMQIEIVPNGVVETGREKTIRVRVQDPAGRSARLEPYLGMTAHGVVVRTDGSVYVHLHPMGTITVAAQEAFLARDRGDTTAGGLLRLDDHARHATGAVDSSAAAVEFPYAFPKSGSYRLFVQVKRDGTILTGAFAIAVADSTLGAR